MGRDRRVSPGGHDGLCENSTKLFAFVEYARRSFLRQQPGQAGESEPAASFFCFLRCDADFVREVGSAFSGAGFVIVRRSRRPAANKLASDMTSQSRVGQRIDHFSYPRREMPQPIRKLLRRHYLRSRQLSLNLHFSIFNSQFAIPLRHLASVYSLNLSATFAAFSSPS